jgi:hypothetical protein
MPVKILIIRLFTKSMINAKRKRIRRGESIIKGEIIPVIYPVRTKQIEIRPIGAPKRPA